jgi:hypothetical protein
MHFNRWILMLAWLAGSAAAPGQAGRNDPRVGYLYPAGACRNTTVEILAGGQNLRGMNGIRVSENGVEARIIKSYRQMRNLDGDQRALLQWRIACRRAEINGKPAPPQPAPPKPLEDGKPAPEVKLPDHPLLDLLGTMTLPEIEHWLLLMQRQDRMQQNPQLGEIIRVEVKVSADAEPGMRELRFSGPQGLSNPVRFEVGPLAEIRELEPNETPANAKTPTTPAVPLPCTFNGQIQSGDVDVLRFRARRGQNLVVKGQARALIPYLADAVPGWFQMVLAVRDAKGNEVAYGDDFRFDPDPVFRFKVPEDGDYSLEVRDSIYRGREDFVYRISVGELPFVTSSFPLGGRQDTPLAATVRGWNLPGEKINLETSAGGQPVRSARMPGLSHEISYAVDSLPETQDAEPNNDAAGAANVPLPCVINGRIDKPGDADVYRIEGRKDMELVVGVDARLLRSPLDSVVHVADESGKVLAWNDDSMEKDGHLHLGDGLLTHHADSRLRVKLPADGPVFIRIADTQNHGGPEFAYRLRISEARPDFELRVTPSVLNIPPGGHVPLRVHVLRHDGFDGEIHLKLEDAPPGFVLSGARIPAGSSQARITLSCPPQHKGGVFKPRLIGTAGKVTRTALAADDMMQAFLWRHLVPADEWLVCVAPGKGKRSAVEVTTPLPLRVPVGALAEVHVKLPKWIVDRGLVMEPSEAPPGITLTSIRPVADGVAFDVKADSTTKAGFETNLIIDVLATSLGPNKPAARGQQRPQIASLPAIPIILTPPNTP